ncbi:MAG TPA: L,D-transpeptidase [Mycobacteriales bacterium]|nr:L,D-transpeptidase [Mycobacteriales bacterium]
MRSLDRYRAYRDDPYRGYSPAFRRWISAASVGLPIAIVVVLVVSIAFAVVHPRAAHTKQLARLSGLGYQSLLIPSSASVPQFRIDGTQGKGGRHQTTAMQQRVVMAAGPAAASSQMPETVRSGAAAHHRVSSTQGHHSYRTDANGYRVAPARDAAMVPATTWVAHLEHSTKGYPSSDAFQSNRKVPGSWYGYPSVLPVIDATRDRLRVRLAQRPDESTTWINRSAVVMGRIHYAIVVDISQHWLYVFYKGVEIESFPVGTGKPGTPTPTGDYFVAFHAPPNGPGYGSVMLETSAHSQVIAHFEGGDDAIIAIHGPVGSDAQIGDHGAAISNGCIRMHDRDLNQVKQVHNGSPVILTY